MAAEKSGSSSRSSGNRDTLRITSKGERWAATGHPWVYRDDLVAQNKRRSGQIVPVQAPNGSILGQAFYNEVSKIALRWVTRDPERLVDRSFWADRLDQALAFRKQVAGDSDAYRLIHAEADGFPGLVVDRYSDAVVLQTLSLGIDQLRPVLVDLLKEKLNPKVIVARNDSSVRKLEGLEPEKQILLGELPGPVQVTEGSVKFLADLWEGQKTGAYLDQRENRIWFGERASGRVLDLCAYGGGFALAAAGRADQVLAIEDSKSAVELFKKNLALNSFSNVEVERANIFDRLKALDQAAETFDWVILDPPAFARSRQQASGALRGYKELNRRALKILKPGGRLITCSCSFAIGESDFLEILRKAAADSGRTVRLLEKRTQSQDHPVLVTHPESAYLKCLVLQAL